MKFRQCEKMTPVELETPSPHQRLSCAMAAGSLCVLLACNAVVGIEEPVDGVDAGNDHGSAWDGAALPAEVSVLEDVVAVNVEDASARADVAADVSATEATADASVTDDASVDGVDAGFRDASAHDGSPRDSAPRADAAEVAPACPGGSKEVDCNDDADNDCDGLVDCADPDCERAQCGSSTNHRCCAARCVDTETDEKNCQGCGLACASDQTCKKISDSSGTRGHCTCTATAQCPNSSVQICREGNNDGQNGVCACDRGGCATGQTCEDVPGANFCHY